MKNLWVVENRPRATWVADLSDFSQSPEKLSDWLNETLQAAEKNSVYSVQQAPLINYDHSRDGELTGFLKHLYTSSGIVDLFDFAHSGSSPVNGIRFQSSARICYFNTGGTKTESDVDDLGELLAGLRTDIPVEETVGLMTRGISPLFIQGAKINFQNPNESVWAYKTGQIKIRFSLYSDIWFPWVAGFLEECFNVHRPHENHDLAQCHTPRLNQFISSVADSTRKYNGKWSLDLEDSRVMAWMLSDDGVILDAVPGS
ncbi:MAG: hypothetical protein OEZ39_15745 [Gammaproteobacteria bacterium]|nr:hypothetical protein [Gammaproteobacteria bacterium]MDH5653310.1 hypothetical protein [Gammaproteobacteria bacterium]